MILASNVNNAEVDRPTLNHHFFFYVKKKSFPQLFVHISAEVTFREAQKRKAPRSWPQTTKKLQGTRHRIFTHPNLHRPENFYSQLISMPQYLPTLVYSCLPKFPSFSSISTPLPFFILWILHHIDMEQGSKDDTFFFLPEYKRRYKCMYQIKYLDLYNLINKK